MTERFHKIKATVPKTTKISSTRIVSLNPADYWYLIDRVEKLEQQLKELMIDNFRRPDVDNDMKEILKRSFKVLHGESASCQY